MTALSTFALGCELIRVNDQARELHLAGLPIPLAVQSRLGDLNAMWDGRRARDLLRNPPTYPALPSALKAAA